MLFWHAVFAIGYLVAGMSFGVCLPRHKDESRRDCVVIAVLLLTVLEMLWLTLP